MRSKVFCCVGVGLLLVIALVIDCQANTPPPEPTTDSLLTAIRFPEPMSFCGEPVPLADRQVRERMEKEMLLTLWDRPQVILWIKRSNRFLPTIETMLRKADLPPDLKYVPFIESALRPHAGSAKGAIGFWQFTTSTGRRYGLRIDAAVDERRSFLASTRAAIAYFKELHDQLGSWTLAAAAYNMGEYGLMAEILAQGSKDYYQLYLPLETQRYVFRALAAKLILSDPATYGFRLAEEALYPPLTYEQVRVSCSDESIPIRLLAEAAQTSFKTIKDLNPELRGHHLATGEHQLLVPKGAARGFKDRFTQVLSRWRRQVKSNIYVVKKGDNLSTIAEKLGVPLPALLIWNRLDPNRPIHPGDRLIIDK